MVDYNTLSVNDGIKPLLRAIGIRSFPAKKADMVARLQEYDRNNPGHPASSLPIPATQQRKKRTPTTSTPGPASTAEPSAVAPRPSRKRKELSPAVQPEPQPKRFKSGGEVERKSSAKGDRDEEMLMPGSRHHEAVEARLSPVEKPDEEHVSQDDAQHDAQYVRRKDAQNVPDDSNKYQIGQNKGKMVAAGAASASSTSRAKRNTDLRKTKKQLKAPVKLAKGLPSRKGKSKGKQATTSKLAQVKDDTNRRAARKTGKTGKTGKTQAMGDKAEAVPVRQGESVQNQSKAVADDTESVVDDHKPCKHVTNDSDDDENTKTGDEEKDVDDDDGEDVDDDDDDDDENTNTGDDEEGVDNDEDEDESGLTPYEKDLAREARFHALRRPGGYADPKVANAWRVKHQTIVVSLDSYYPEGHPRWLPDHLIFGKQWEDRMLARAKKEGRELPRMTCKSPEQWQEKEMVDYYEIHGAPLERPGTPSKRAGESSKRAEEPAQEQSQPGESSKSAVEPAQEQGQPGHATAGPSGPPKRGKKRAADAMEDEDEDSKGWLENERQKRRVALQRAQRDASIPGFERRLRELKDGRREGPTKSRAAVAAANKAVGGSKNFDQRVRANKHHARRAATRLYEDFMYFQSPQRRTQYNEHIDSWEKEMKNPFRKEMAPGKLFGEDPRNDGELRALIESFEQRGIGTLEETGLQRRGPAELHTLIPTRRRRAAGVGAGELDDDAPEVILSIDEEAIERRRAQIEDVQGDITMKETHSERRAREVAALGKDLPTKWFVNEFVPTAVSFDRTRQESGLFIAAGETSRDWLDSYDSLDIVKPGVTAVERTLLHLGSDAESEDEDDQDQPQPDYPGSINEFSKEKQPHKTYRLVPTTQFAETAYGRREREHIHMFLAPSSPVDSPPHSPIPRTDIQHDFQKADPEHLKYRAKLRDPHGILYKQWPNPSLEVPYAPVDVAALPTQLQARYQSSEKGLGDADILDGARVFNGPAPEGTSMRLLREAKGQKYRPPIRPPPARRGPWDSDDDGSDGGGEVDPGGDDGDSDFDDGDLFRRAYMEASRLGDIHEDGNAGDGGAGDDVIMLSDDSTLEHSDSDDTVFQAGLL
ncbi:hypothetical protein DE146DRAFT_736974 [Phaeosphaeria sp. MPI-PUGE-AT-0046c]|nr:hypothetical protein DE146DRAFT_736974 [Phaeosphaeria sp. MPI-PUGE-AT-0046c]